MPLYGYTYMSREFEITAIGRSSTDLEEASRNRSVVILIRYTIMVQLHIFSYHADNHTHVNNNHKKHLRYEKAMPQLE